MNEDLTIILPNHNDKVFRNLEELKHIYQITNIKTVLNQIKLSNSFNKIF